VKPSTVPEYEAAQRANRRRYEEAESLQLDRLERALAEGDGGPPAVERAYCFVCGGACPLEKDGHDICRGRKAA
jgi:hypothetical protein